MAVINNKIIRGTFGRLWINGELASDIKSFEAKVSLDYEDIHVNGDFGTQKRYMGYSISGTMTMHKINSRILRMYSAGMMNGQLPDVRLDAALADPDSNGAQRVVLFDVTFDEVTLAQFENNTVLEEEVPFTAGSYKVTEMISDSTRLNNMTSGTRTRIER